MPQIVEGANRSAGMSKLAGKRVLVTGGAGFIGSHIVDLLANEGCRRIVAIDNFVRGDPKNLAQVLSHENVSPIEGDIRDRGRGKRS